MGDTGFQTLRDAMQNSENWVELHASLCAPDAYLARLVACWPNLTAADRAAVVECAVRVSAGNHAEAVEVVVMR